MRSQRGQVLVALVMLLGLVLVYFSVQWWTPAKAKAARQQATIQALQNAKTAILSYALTKSTAMPNLPCPVPANQTAQTNPGTCGSSAEVTTNFTLGMIPWTDLGAQRQIDGTGGDIWYGVMDDYKVDFSPSGTYDPVHNSYKKISYLKVMSDDTTNATSVDAAFVVIAPGELKSGQSRPPSGTPLGSPQADGYSQYDLDKGTQNNYKPGGPFYMFRPESANVRNDVVDYVSAENYVRETEKKVAQIAMKILQDDVTIFTGKDPQGRDVCGEGGGCGLPNPADPVSCQGGIVVDDAESKSNPKAKTLGCLRKFDQPRRCQGNFPLRLPIETDLKKYFTYSPTDKDHSWFYLQGWPQQIYYAIYSSSTNCDYKFSVNGVVQEDRTAVLIFPGLPRSNQTRPSTDLNQYLEGNQFNDDAIKKGNINFQTPTAESNDLLCVFTCTRKAGGPDNQCGKLIKQCY